MLVRRVTRKSSPPASASIDAPSLIAFDNHGESDEMTPMQRAQRTTQAKRVAGGTRFSSKGERTRSTRRRPGEPDHNIGAL